MRLLIVLLFFPIAQILMSQNDSTDITNHFLKQNYMCLLPSTQNITLKKPNAWLYTFYGKGEGKLQAGFCDNETEKPYGPLTLFDIRWNVCNNIVNILIYSNNKFIAQQIFMIEDEGKTLTLVPDFLNLQIPLKLTNTLESNLFKIHIKTLAN